MTTATMTTATMTTPAAAPATIHRDHDQVQTDPPDLVQGGQGRDGDALGVRADLVLWIVITGAAVPIIGHIITAMVGP